MFKFLKELKDSFKEGAEEAKIEAEANEALEVSHLEKLDTVLRQPTPTLENVVVALSCPLRETFVSGDVITLFILNEISEKEVNNLKKLLVRDFNIVDKDDVRLYVQTTFIEWKKITIVDIATFNLKVYVACQMLYTITSSIEVGYITLDTYVDKLNEIKNWLFSQNQIQTWEDYGKAVVAGDDTNNKLGKKILTSSCNKLLKASDSPWSIYTWSNLKEDNAHHSFMA